MMKKVLSVILIAALVTGSLAFSAGAQTAYPESAHDYANNACETWTYTYPAQASGLYIRFSDDTYLNTNRTYRFITEDADEQQIKAFLQNGVYETDGDYLEIIDGNGALCFTLRGSDAVGKTFFITGNRFTIVLHSDFTGTGYGFRIADVSTQDVAIPRDGYGSVCYTVDGCSVRQYISAGKPVELRSEFAMRQYGERILVGWETEDGHAYYYDNTGFYTPSCTTDLVLRSRESCTLRPIWCPIAMRKEEVFSFSNSSSVFNADLDGYLFTRRQFLRILPNWIGTFALSPLAPFAALFCAFYLFIWPTMDFIGSCCGFPIATMLQHYGKIDLLSSQNVSDVCELQPDDFIQSTINYYNIHAATAFLTNHLALMPGTAEYGSQLHALYDTLESGKPVYFELYGDGPHLLRRILADPVSLIKEFDNLTVHGVLLTGAYTDGSGNHILIMNDNNSGKYVNGTCDILYIDPDFSQIYSTYACSSDDALDGFSWNDELDQFDSFKPTGISNPFKWHLQFMKNLPSLLRQIAALYKKR